MKKVLLFSILVFLLSPKAFAEVKTSVTTNVNGSSESNSENNSQTKTRIEIEVNGERQVLDTNEPGTHTLSIDKDGGKSSATVQINGNVSSSNNSSQDESEEEGPEDFLDDDGEIMGSSIQEEEVESNNIIRKIFEEIKDFLERLFDL